MPQAKEFKIATLQDKNKSQNLKAQPKGFVYKVYMNLDNLSKQTPLITKKIKQMKGIKAGRVKLGWRKSNGSYFHFSLPESNHPKLLQELKKFSAVRIQKESHQRIMPTGQIRMILWIEQSPSSR